MRLWTLHPRYLDAKGLVAAWREGLLAQKVLMGATRGYRHHPQLARFRARRNPVAAIATYLAGLADEARRRDYNFDTTRIAPQRSRVPMAETRGQLLYEWAHLKRKLRARAPEDYRRIASIREPKPHPIFRIVPGDARDWEIR